MTDTRKAKGNIVEEIVASFHENENYIVERKVHLPLRSDPRFSREIDVLVTSKYPTPQVPLAIECKNYGSPINPRTISEFAGRLQEVGIPPERGVIVGTRAGFTANALAVADFHQITPLVLDGLDGDRIAAQVQRAFQSTIYLRLSITRLTINTDIPIGDFDILAFLRDRRGNLQGGIPDLVWADWRDGLLPDRLGSYEMKVRIPRDWEWQFQGEAIPSAAIIQFKIDGVATTFTGNAHSYSLVNANTDELSKFSIKAKFPPPHGSPHVTVLHSEDELNQYFDRDSVAELILGRIRLPRILFNFYWPISTRVALTLDTRTRSLIRQRIPPELDPNPPSWTQLEGTDLSTFWDPIWPLHPASKKQDWPWGRSNRQKRKVVSIADQD